MRKREQIPILGIDARPLDRDAPAGLCQEITNLRPSGPKEKPYWEAVAAPNQLTNDNGVPFTHPNRDQIVATHWQERSSIDDPSSSPDRLIVGLATGTIQIIDPNLEEGWNIVTDFDVGNTNEAWDYSFANINQLVVIGVQKNNQPEQLYYLDNNSFYDVDLPDLPDITITCINKNFSQTEYDAGTYDGLESGWYGLQYGYESASGAIIKSSVPHYFHVGETEYDVDGIIRTMLKIHIKSKGGAANAYTNLPISITGLSFFLSERKEKRDELFDATYYNIETLDQWNYEAIPDKVDPTGSLRTDLESSNLLFTYEGKTSDVPLGESMDLDDFSSQKISASVVDSYNSRLVLGDTKTVFQPTSILNQNASPVTLLRIHRNAKGDGQYLMYLYLSCSAAFFFKNAQVYANPYSSSQFPDYDGEPALRLARKNFIWAYGGTSKYSIPHFLATPPYKQILEARVGLNSGMRSSIDIAGDLYSYGNDYSQSYLSDTFNFHIQLNIPEW